MIMARGVKPVGLFLLYLKKISDIIRNKVGKCICLISNK